MILLKNGLVADGSGERVFNADILISGDKIEKIIRKEDARPGSGLKQAAFDNSSKNTEAPENASLQAPETYETYDISGCVVCPGFIDSHAHSELEILRHPSMPYKIMQGITSDVSGNCGVGVYPKKTEDNNLFPDILGHYADSWDWNSFSTFSSYLENKGFGMNIAFLQPHANLRLQAISGNPNRKATTREIDTMCELLDESLRGGCVGFSGGIYYAPNIYASRDEYIALLKIVRAHNKIFSVHHRCEGTEIISSVREILDFARESGVRLEISHLKVIGTKNQDKIDTVIKMIEDARSEGVDVSFDAYPYEYGSTSLFSLLPPDYLRLENVELRKHLRTASENRNSEEYVDLVSKMSNPEGWDSIMELCGPENITAVILENNQSFNGKTLSECAEILRTDPYTALFKLLSEEKGAALMADVTQSRDNLLKIARHPLCSFGTDALYVGEMGHPRSSSAAVHYLVQNVYRTHNLTLEEAVFKMTSLNAERFGFEKRGLIRSDYYADLVVFNPEKLKDTASLSHPFSPNEGIVHVLVNGEFALKNGALTGKCNGKLILR